MYSTYLVGAAGKAIAVDANGHAFITGGATDKLPIEDAVQPIPGDMYGADVFVTEFDTAGESLLYSTFLGGSSLDEGKGIAVDTEGNAYVTGITYSPDFPIGDSFPAAVAATESSASNKRNNRAVRAGMMGASVQR